jgi:cell division protein FtsQ
LANLTAGLAGVAKNDLFSGLASVVEKDEEPERFYRPAAPSKTRPARPKETPAARSEARAWPGPPAADDEERGGDPFLRTRRRVQVRRGVVPKTRTGRILFATVIVLSLALLVVLALSVRSFFLHDSRFRIDSAASIQIVGNSQVTRPELLSVFGGDIGRNIFFVPLAQRRAQLERLPWVAQASVMRLLPNQLRVSIVERVPVAFLRDGSAIKLVDASGVPLAMSPQMLAAKHYSFPVVTGITIGEAPDVRAARMRLYQKFIGDLNSGGARVSSQLSEVDISDPEDVRAVMPTRGGDLLVHFGETDFLQRYQRYRQHLSEWLRQYPRLASVDLRYNGQVVLEMAGDGAEPRSGSSTAPAKAPNHAQHAASLLRTNHPLKRTAAKGRTGKSAAGRRSAVRSSKHSAGSHR